ncbi:hypothetical protein PF005_g3796 [Phytophthora fragariae]|uniref:Reverse transcriptase domain-containing protein n=1 Tax=Phytophthora fragariae TaxID=53985 RepID=A0A6A3FPV1_9STRA|nr:hypothetical protein PF003_g31159 [Phytophthora fragariae]KAE8946421.1 hypothetical protein PF009_g3953 [Phytophthora fragariae]KAE9025425.1 hypothetical protein PF011_g3035 [Phytophthora fragariae]KAE9131830.1 hypothetical protein PF010_g3395 [Phytophthora fragariae]KAE9132469.1 hypothetical protein PF007_g3707 [Phytophthora fragariae]
MAQTAVREAVKEVLEGFASRLPQEGELDAATSAIDWDLLKIRIRKKILTVIKQRRRTARASFKQKLKRLLRQERRLLELAAGQAISVDMVTDMMDVLTLDDRTGESPLQRVRGAITDCIRGRAAAKQRQLFRSGGYYVGKTSRQFFSRISTKYADNEIHRLDAATGQPARGVHDKADTLADAWTPVFQQPSSLVSDRGKVLQWLGPSGQYDSELHDLMAPFSEAEVAAAIGACHAGKACGPDRLGNDWYRDFCTILTPILTRLFNCWYSTGRFPTSFLEADIFCIAKGGDSQDPLNYRPLALLDTDYKILTRIITTRASRKLHLMIHPNQNGFVPFRTIHSTLDLYTAAQAVAQTDPEYAEALALLLDFSKAYDSVDREFLYAVLLWLGFPSPFVEAMRGLHEDTKVRFLANGYHSRWVTVTCGIRQGCPLAPLLFLLVLEALYRRIDNAPEVSGIVLRSRAGMVRLKVGGYADDTATYVKTPTEVTMIIMITRLFAYASGLRLNEGKTLVIALNPSTVANTEALPSPLRLQAPDKLARYLGLQVGSKPDMLYTWQLARTQLTARLAIAASKTTTVDQRSTIVMAIVLPKLLYIGRHQWPDLKTVGAFQKMIHNFIWHARFTDERVGGRAWLNEHIAMLPRQLGGIAVPDLKTELIALAAVTVNMWALDASPEAQIVEDVLTNSTGNPEASMVYISPHQVTPPKKGQRLGASLRTTGVHTCNVYGGVVMVAGKAAMVQALNSVRYFKGRITLTWRGRRMRMDTSSRRGTLWRAAIREEEKAHGTFCLEWLPFLVLSELKVYSEGGHMVNPKHRFRLLCTGGKQLKDHVHWKWTSNGDLLTTALATKVTPAVQRQIGSLMRLLVLNYPQLLYPGDHTGQVRYSTEAVGHVPILRRVTAGRALVGLAATEEQEAEAQVMQSHRCLVENMHTAAGTATTLTAVHPHPRLSRIVCLWVGKRRWATSRRVYRRFLTHQRTKKCIGMSTVKAERWRTSSPHIAHGLADITWRRIRRVIGLNPWGEQLLLRIKHHAISVYNPVSEGLSCPHASCSRTTRTDLTHVFWTCPAAQVLRGVLLKRWQSAGLRLIDTEHAIFSLTLPGIPAEIISVTGRVLAECSEETLTALGNTVERLTAACWSLGAAHYLHAVWRWRVAHFDTHNDVTQNYHTAGLITRLRNGHADIMGGIPLTVDDKLRWRLGRAICAVLGADWTGSPTTAHSGGGCYLLFFAGGDGAQQASGGSGIVIATLDRITGGHKMKYFLGSTHTGANMTPTMAAHIGLLRGLRECLRQGWAPVHAVGDNQVGIRQYKTRTPPRVKRLAGTYWKARRTADAIGVQSWLSQPREFNRTAQGLAQLARTTGAGTEWTEHQGSDHVRRWAAITSHALSDATEWSNLHRDQDSSESERTKV